MALYVDKDLKFNVVEFTTTLIDMLECITVEISNEISKNVIVVFTEHQAQVLSLSMTG